MSHAIIWGFVLHNRGFATSGRERLKLFQGSILYRDKRLKGFDAIVLSEVIEHLDETRLETLTKHVFGFLHPRIEALERFVKREPLYRVHECVFAVLALESEPVDHVCNI